MHELQKSWILFLCDWNEQIIEEKYLANSQQGTKNDKRHILIYDSQNRKLCVQKIEDYNSMVLPETIFGTTVLSNQHQVDLPG